MREHRVRSVAGKLLRGHRFRVLSIVLVVVVVGLGMLTSSFEQRAESARITDMWDGIYFAVTTVTGVGYGDMVPVTDWGRVVAMVLQTVGVVLFGAIVALIAVELLRYQEDYYVRRMFSRIDELEVKLLELKKHIDFLVKK